MYQNPILYGDYSDPDVIRVSEDYYMVSSSFTYLPGVPLLHSKDLVHWEIINHCVTSLPFEIYDQPAHGSGTWAPSIRYREGVFYVFIPLPDQGIFVARSSDPYGEFQLHCLVEAKGWIDPCPLWDDDGKTYMIFAFANSRCGIKNRLAMVEIDHRCQHVLGEPKVVFEGRQLGPTTEGPKIYKYQGQYYVFAPSGGVSTGWQAVLKSDSVWGPYEYRIVMHQGTTQVNGPHQGGWVTAQDGSHWFVHFQDVTELGRIIHLQPLCFNGEWPFIGVEENGDGIGEPVTAWNLPVKGQPCYEIAASDRFDTDRLGLQWQWQANPRAAFYSLAGHPGLRLFCLANESRENLLWYAPNALTQMPQHQTMRAVTKVKLVSQQEGDLAGMGMIGHFYSYLGLLRREGTCCLALIQGEVLETEMKGKAVEHLAETISYDGERVYLKLEILRNKTYVYSWSEDGIHYQRIGEKQPLHKATWTGGKLCLWCCNQNNRNSKGYGEYEWIHIEDGSRC